MNELPTDGDGNYVMTTLGQEIIKFGDDTFPYQKFDNLKTDTLHTQYIYNRPINVGLSTTTTGLFIDSAFGQREGDLLESTDEMVELADDSMFANSLLQKLGFDREDLFLVYGQPHRIVKRRLHVAEQVQEREAFDNQCLVFNR